MNKNNYVAIMAGGVGSRFWPGSRESRPKQFLDMMGIGKSLLRMTFERFLKICPAENIFIVTNEQYRALVKEHLPELTDNQIVGEPSRNNTAPCVAFTAFKIHALNPNANFVVAPSDHVVLKEDAFVEKINQALDFASKNDALLTLGIAPTRPDTGYGYIHYQTEGKQGIHKVKAFTEKPNLETATAFLKTGEYLWNAGIFIWSSKAILSAYKKHATDIFDLFQTGEGLYNSGDEREYMNTTYPQSRSVAVDVAIMEKADNVYTLPADIGWSDLGTWASLYDFLDKDKAQNVVQANAITLQTKDTFIRSSNPKKLIVARGLEDFIVVDDIDILLIYPKHKEQEIKQMRSIVEKSFGEKYT